MPEGVRDVIGRRLSMLDDATNDVLRAAAVLGQEFELSRLAELTDRDAMTLLDARSRSRPSAGCSWRRASTATDSRTG